MGERIISDEAQARLRLKVLAYFRQPTENRKLDQVPPFLEDVQAGRYKLQHIKDMVQSCHKAGLLERSPVASNNYTVYRLTRAGKAVLREGRRADW